MKKSKAFFKELLETASPTGYESQGVRVFSDYLTLPGVLTQVDEFGNCVKVIGDTKDPDALKIMISAHIDEIGLQISYIDESGFAYLERLGGVDNSTLLGAEVEFISKTGEKVYGIIGKKPIHVDHSEDYEERFKLENIAVDFGCTTREELLELVSIGTPGVVRANVNLDFGKGKIMSRGLDDKVGIYIISEVANRITTLAPNIKGVVFYFTALCQEEAGLRGAIIAGKRLNPDIAIDVDVTIATDDNRGICPKKYGEVSLGKGPVINHGPGNHPKLVASSLECAALAGIKVQEIVVRPGGVNSSEIQVSALDCATMELSIPLRNMHTAVEVADWKDINDTIELLTKILEKNVYNETTPAGDGAIGDNI